MSSDVPLVCSCGSVRGSIAGVSPETVNRVVCYCDDCQAYAHHLGRAALLDEHGGSDVVQVAPATLSFARGTEHIVAVGTYYAEERHPISVFLHRIYEGPCRFVVKHAKATLAVAVLLVLGTIPEGTSRTLDALKKAQVPVFAYGSFLTILVNFLILAFIIFVMIKQVNRLKRSEPPAEPPASPPELAEDVLLLREIRDSLRK